MAGSRTYRTKAIVLDKTKLKETDLILTLVDQTGRQIRAVAKGARKPGSRLAARCELCCEVDLLLAHGRSLDIVSQAELIAAPLGSQPTYELLATASAVAEVAERCTYEDAEDPFVYPITRAALAQLAQADPAHQDLLVAAYVFKLLSHVGYRPDYSCCVACDDEHPTYFSGPGRRLAVRQLRAGRSRVRAGGCQHGAVARGSHCPAFHGARRLKHRPPYRGAAPRLGPHMGCHAPGLPLKGARILIGALINGRI